MRPAHIVSVTASISIALANGAAAQSPVKFPSGPVPYLQVATPGTILFQPDAGKGPWSVVVLLPTCAGVNAATYDWAGRLVRAGRMALVLDSYTPRNVQNNCQGGVDTAVTQRHMADDIAAALAWLRTLPMVKPDRFAVVGFSFGAMAAAKLSVGSLQRRLTPPIVGLRAVAAFYPGCGTSQPFASANVTEFYDWGGDVTTPLMLFLGAKDDETPPRFCTDKADRARSRGQPVSYKVYEDTTHAFDYATLGNREFRRPLGGNRGTATYRYNQASTEASAAALLAFLAGYLD
jgi:dienelactone hydrolase